MLIKSNIIRKQITTKMQIEVDNYVACSVVNQGGCDVVIPEFAVTINPQQYYDEKSNGCYVSKENFTIDFSGSGEKKAHLVLWQADCELIEKLCS